jgi:hypothetical protein
MFARQQQQQQQHGFPECRSLILTQQRDHYRNEERWNEVFYVYIA